MAVRLNVPDAVGQSSSSGTGHLLLVETPLRKLDFVGKQDTVSHDVHQTELGLDSPQSLLRLLTLRQRLHNFNTEEIVCISRESVVSIGRHLELPIHICDRRPLIMRVNAPPSDKVIQPDHSPVFYILCGDVVPGQGALHCSVGTKRLSLVLKDENVVLILVGVERYLLLLASRGVHVIVRMKIASLGVEVTDADARSKCNIGGNVLHPLRVQGCLELGRHESISIAGVDKAQEVDSKHGAVEAEGNNNQAEDTSKEVLEPQALYDKRLAPVSSRSRSMIGSTYRCDILRIAKQHPQLENSKRPNPSNGEESNPFDAECSAQREASCHEPEPPGSTEGVRRSQFLLVGKARERQCGERSEEHQWGIQEN